MDEYESLSHSKWECGLLSILTYPWQKRRCGPPLHSCLDRDTEAISE